MGSDRSSRRARGWIGLLAAAIAAAAGCGEAEPNGVTTQASGPSSSSTTSTPFAVGLTASPEHPAPGTPVRLSVTMTPTDGFLHVRMQYGEGEDELRTLGDNCGAVPPLVVARTTAFEHQYPAAGTFAVVALVTLNECGPGHASTEAPGRLQLEVGRSATPSNGPALPTITVRQVPAETRDPALTYIEVTAVDPDAVINTVHIDWRFGDSPSTETHTFDPAPCVLGRPVTAVYGHRYQAPIGVLVTVEATSAGCDGKEGQRALTDFGVAATGP